MKKAQHFIFLVNTISLLLIAEPVLKVLVLKNQTGLEWSLVWSNILDNSQTFSRFFLFWVLSPLTGIFLLTYSRLAYGLYFLLSIFKIYQIASFTPYSWPYMTKNPHGMAILFEVINIALMSYLFYPLLQRFFLSRYLRNYWDARGRKECQIEAQVYIEGHQKPVTGIIQNISPGGVSFVATDLGKLNYGKIVFFDFEGQPMSFDFKCKGHRAMNSQFAYGLEFQGLTPKEKIYLRSSILESPLEKNRNKDKEDLAAHGRV